MDNVWYFKIYKKAETAFEPIRMFDFSHGTK